MNAPIAYIGRSLLVNPGVAPAAGSLTAVRRHGSIRVAYGRVADGVGAGELIDYMTADAAGSWGRPLKPYTSVLTVRIVEGATPEMIDQTVRAVQLINAALPPEWRLRVDEVLATREFADEIGVLRCERLECDALPIPHGDIIVQFEAAKVWSKGEPGRDGRRVSGQAEFNRNVMTLGTPTLSNWAGRVWVDPARVAGAKRLHVLVHELLHILGRNHADPERFTATVMRPSFTSVRTGEILYPLDREVLLAVYGVLDPFSFDEEIVRALESWDDTSTHLRGVLDPGDGEVAFGVGLRNGLARPWASGIAPSADPGRDLGLSGSLTWSGRVLGLTRRKEVVGGAAELTIRLDTLNGTLTLTALESWPGDGQPPGAPGTGTRWREGRLSYRVGVRGNSFVVTGGAVGEVTGALFGSSHAGMGGVLQQDGLSAGFGGRR